MDLPDSAVLITGGSRGLGRALAERLAARGCKLVLVARDAAAVEAAAAAIRQRGGIAHGIAADLADKPAIHRIAGEASALVGPIDVLINNASTLGRTPLSLLIDSECEDLERVLAVNLLGPFRLTKAVLGSMLLRDRGVVINVSSDAAEEPYPSWGGYGASKAALDQLTRIWAAEHAGSNVRIFSVDPGEMDTAMHAAAIPEADPSALARPSEVAARIVEMLEQPERAPSGARLIASRWSAAAGGGGVVAAAGQRRNSPAAFPREDSR